MFSNIKKSKSGKILLSILLLSGILLLVGCASAPVRGWSGPVVSNNILYVGTIKGTVLALDITENGTSCNWKWERDLGKTSSGGFLTCSRQVSVAMSTYGTAAVSEDAIYIGGYDGNIYSFTKDKGYENSKSLGSAIIGSPTVDNDTDTVFVGCSDGKLYALYLDLRSDPKWVFPTGGKIWSTPEVANGVVYISSADHKLYAIDIESGREIWHFEAEAGILSTPLVFNNTVYIGACDNKFYAIDAATDAERKAAAEGTPASAKEARSDVFDKAESWFWTKAFPYNGKIWVGCLDHKVYALNAQNLNDYQVVCETKGRVLTPPVLVDGLIMVGSEDGNIYKIDPINEKQVGKPIYLGAPVLAPIFPDPENGVIYVHAQDNTHKLYAIQVATDNPPYELYTTSG